MALINCPECGKEISDKANACPNCGAPIEVISSKKIPVTFTREKRAIVGSGVEGTVFIDEQKVGTINNGESFTTEVSVGTHRITIDANQSETSKKASFWLGIQTQRVHNTSFRILEIKESTSRILLTCKVTGENCIEVVDIEQY